MDAIRRGLVIGAGLALAISTARAQVPVTDDWAMRFAQAERLRQDRATSDRPGPRPGAPPVAAPETPSPPIPPPAGGLVPTPPLAPAAPPSPVVPPAGPAAPIAPPPPVAAAAPSALEAAAAAGDLSLTGDLGLSVAPVMLGDQAPPAALRLFPRQVTPPPPPVPPVPPFPPTPPAGRVATTALVPSARGFKISENQSPRPQDRVFFTFAYFADINGAINRQLGGLITNMTVYRELLGIEKTFLDGNASLGLRMPIDTLVVRSPFQAIGGTDTAVGNVSIFGKYVLMEDEETGSLLSSGLSITTPTGPSRFAGSPAAVPIRDVLFQPFLGFILARDRWYLQGFTAIDVPTDNDDVTLYYNDIGLGYYLIRNEDPDAFITALAPTFEVHINTPLNHRGTPRIDDPFNTPDVVDFTYGVNMLFNRRCQLSVGVITPVTGPRPFDYEFLALFNIYFGRTARSAALPSAPLFAGP